MPLGTPVTIASDPAADPASPRSAQELPSCLPLCVKGRIACSTSARRRIISSDEKKHDISEDERKRLEGEVQKLTDDVIKDIDETSHSKEKEILNK